MRIVVPTVDLFQPTKRDNWTEAFNDEKPLVVDFCKDIEIIARVCTGTDEKVNQDWEANKKFVSNLVKRGHESVLEHRRMRLVIPIALVTKLFGIDEDTNDPTVCSLLSEDFHILLKGLFSGEGYRHLTVHLMSNKRDVTKYEYWVEGNIHAWRDYFVHTSVRGTYSDDEAIKNLSVYGGVENIFMKQFYFKEKVAEAFCRGLDTCNARPFFFDLNFAKRSYECETVHEDDMYVENCLYGYYTARITADIGVLREWARHRVAITQSSTRYIKYSTCEYIDSSLVFPMRGWKSILRKIICSCHMFTSSIVYSLLLKLGCKPQEARGMLPLSFISTLFITATAEEWRKILRLRMDKAAHPQARQIAAQIYKLIVNASCRENERVSGSPIAQDYNLDFTFECPELNNLYNEYIKDTNKLQM